MSRQGPRTLLTAQERAALNLAATGLDLAQIADAMNEPPSRIRARLRSAQRKLGARSRLEAVVTAAQTGEIDSADR